MPDSTTKAAIRCTKCNKFRKHDQYTGHLTANEDPSSPVCDDCRSDSAKALQKTAEDRRAEWAEAAETIGNMLKSLEHRNPEFVAKARAADIAAICKRLDRRTEQFYKAVAEETRQLKLQKTVRSAVKRAVNLRKAEQIRQRTDALRKQTAEIQQRNAAAEAHIAETMGEIAKAQADHEQMAAEAEAFFVSASAKIDQMMARAAAGQAQVRGQQEYAAMREAARRGREQDEWTFKAGTTSDPVLRAAYTAKANGEDIDDDE